VGLDPLRDVIRGGYERGRARYGELRLDPDRFARAVLARVDVRMRAAGRDPTARGWSEALERTELADLYLAVACSEHGDTAWRVLNARFHKRLEGVAVRNGVAPGGAAPWVRDALADLGVDRRAGQASSRLVAYDGSCSLEGWLAFAVLRRARAPVDTDDARLDDPRIVAGAEGRLAPEQAMAVQAGAATTGEVRVLLEDFLHELNHGQEETAPPLAAPAAGRSPSARVRLAAVAALVAGVLGVGAWALLAGRSPEAPHGGSTEERLVAAGEALAAQGSPAFRGFHPVTAVERALGVPGREPGPATFVVLRPRGVSLDGRPMAAWTAVPGARQYTVRMLDAKGATVWHRTTEGTELAYPAEAAPLPAREAGVATTCEVAADTPQGREVARTPVAVADADERASAISLLAEAGGYGDGVVARLLQAHVALRHDWWDEAERLTRLAAVGHGDDPVVRGTLAYLRFEGPVGR